MNRNMTGSLSGVIDEMLSGSVAGNIEVQTPQGSTNYNDLTNKPSINDIPLQGNKTTEELGLFSGDYDDLTNKPTIPDAPTVMTGATSQTNGVAGYVPQPQAGDQNKFLNGGGEWVTLQSNGVNYSTDEQLVGTWLGSPLYQKTFPISVNITSLSRTWYNVIPTATLQSLNANNIFISQEGSYLVDPGDGTLYPIPYSSVLGSNGGLCAFAVLSDGADLCLANVSQGIANGYLTIRYTKLS